MNMAERSVSQQGELRVNEPMASHTTWRVGGPVRRFYRPAGVEDLCAFLAELPQDEPVYWLGLGSNLLVRDGGLPGTVIYTFGGLDALAAVDAVTLRVEAGVACAKVARESARRGLTGGEFLAGIPGTLGGALAMNAGAFGGETWTLVARVVGVDRHGALHVRRPSEYRVGYRSVQGPAEEWFVAAELRFTPGDTQQAQRRIRELLAQRNDTQPTTQASCGSVFRNPPGDHAARLIDTAGLKGLRVGGAQVSEKHANFIVNTGEATAADIEALIERVQAEVERVHGVRLEPEVRIVGERK